MSHYNIIAKVVVQKGGAQVSTDGSVHTHTGLLNHTIKDVFSLLRGGKHAEMTQLVTCYVLELRHAPLCHLAWLRLPTPPPLP